MAFLSSMNITGSALTAQQLRLDVVSENVANINTTRVEGGEGPYQRKMVVMEADGGRDTFRQVLAQAAGNDAMAATQAYSANVTAFNTLKTVATRALDIGK